MNVATSSKTSETELAAVLAPVAPKDFYEAVLDVRGFPAWAPGVRRVGVLSGEGGAGMLSEWEVSFLGFGKTVRNVLEEAENPSRLHWTYGGPVEGWGGCSIERVGECTLASFRTALAPTDPLLASLARSAAARGAVRTHLKRSLSRLGRLVAGDDTRVLVGPVVEHLQPGAQHHAGGIVGAGFKPTLLRRVG
jgi:polyketide cyclase/dehydrase/lipid transport protein